VDWISLSGYNSRNRPDSTKKGIAVLTISAGTTRKIQPLDSICGRISSRCSYDLLDLDVKLHSRNAILKLQSLTHNQFLSPRFTNLFVRLV